MNTFSHVYQPLVLDIFKAIYCNGGKTDKQKYDMRIHVRQEFMAEFRLECEINTKPNDPRYCVNSRLPDDVAVILKF